MRILEVAMSGTIGTRHMGPISTVICELTNRFADRGHEVSLVDAPSEIPRHLLHPGIRLIELSTIPQGRIAASPRNKIINLFRIWRNYSRCVGELRSLVNTTQAQVVHLHDEGLAFLLQRTYGIRCFYTAHTPLWSLSDCSGLNYKGGHSDRVRPSRARSVHERVDAWIERDVVRRSRLTIGLGDYLAAAVPEADVVTIPNGIDFDAWSQIERSSARQALGICAQDFVVLFAGRIARVKGVDVLLEAVRSLAHVLPNLNVFIIGALSGSYDNRDEYVTPYVQKLLKASRGLPVRFLGFINNRDLTFRQYLAAADVSVVPSRREPQGLVVLESLAMGTPVIGSATGGIPDMVSPDVGYLFPPEDSAALAARIKNAHDDAGRLRGMRLVSRSRIQAGYSWDVSANRYLAAFMHRLSATSRAPLPAAAAAPTARNINAK